ncbi:MAG: hypothetical protein CMI35_01590 [Owenweeksia sp.]|nr:hypothetical protein [Owenweeksia sp.]|tara:strand:- start:24883 stop:26244 length:1362 start_codon:yes stop_codon:yes gene_type:complete
MTRLVVDNQLLDFLKSKSRDNPVCKVITDEIENPKDRYRRKDKKHFSGQVNFLGFSQDAPHFISYLTEDRLERMALANMSPWEANMRFRGKAGKVIRKLFTPEGLKPFKDQDIEQFSNLFKSFCDATGGYYDFGLVEGEDIRKYYHEDHYSHKFGIVGTLWDSCMRYECCQDYLDIYTENVNTVSMLVLFDEHKAILGRALVWWDVFFKGEARNVMDRIYCVRDCDVEAFKDYADRKGWVYKAAQNCSDKNAFIDQGKKVFDSVSVDLHYSEFSEYPYMDTFTYKSGGTLWNDSEYGDVALEDTHGGYDDDHRVYDEHTGNQISAADAQYCQVGGGYCHHEDAIYLDYRDEHGLPDECVWSRIEYRDLAREDAVELADGDYAHQDNTVYSNVTYEDYHLDQVVWSDYHDDYIPKDEAVELENGEYVHQDDEQEALDYYGLNEEDETEDFSQAA